MKVYYEYSFERMKACNGNAADDADYLSWFLQETRKRLDFALEEAEIIIDRPDWRPSDRTHGLSRLEELLAFYELMESNLSGLVTYYSNTEKLREQFWQLHIEAQVDHDMVSMMRGQLKSSASPLWPARLTAQPDQK